MSEQKESQIPAPNVEAQTGTPTSKNIIEDHPEELLNKSYADSNSDPIIGSNHNTEDFMGDLFHNISYEMVFGIVTGFFAFILGFTAWGGSFLDLYTKVHGPSNTSGEVVVVNITPQSLHMWAGPGGDVDVTPRGMLVQLINFLDEAGAKTITLDVLLNTPQPGDEELSSAISSHGNVIAATQIVHNQPHDPTSLFVAGTMPYLEMDGSYNRQMVTGYANVYQEEPIFFGDTMVTRGVHPFQRAEYLSSVSTWPNVEPTEQRILFPISLLTAMVQNDIDGSFSLSDLQSSITNENDHCTTTLQGYIDTESCQHEAIWLLLSAPESQSEIPQVDAASMLRAMATYQVKKQLYIDGGLGSIPPFPVPDNFKEAFEGKAVIVGRVDQSEGNFDRHTTTYSFPLFGTYDMAGVHLQAQYVDAFLMKRFVHFLPKWVEWFMSFLMIFLSYRMYKRVSIRHHIPVFVCVTTVLFGIGCLLFSYGNYRVLELGGPITASLLTIIWLNVRWPRKP